MSVYRLELRSKKTGKVVDPFPKVDEAGAPQTFRTAAEASAAARAFVCEADLVCVPVETEGGPR